MLIKTVLLSTHVVINYCAYWSCGSKIGVAGSRLIAANNPEA